MKTCEEIEKVIADKKLIIIGLTMKVDISWVDKNLEAIQHYSKALEFNKGQLDILQWMLSDD